MKALCSPYVKLYNCKFEIVLIESTSLDVTREWDLVTERTGWDTSKLIEESLDVMCNQPALAMAPTPILTYFPQSFGVDVTGQAQEMPMTWKMAATIESSSWAKIYSTMYRPLNRQVLI